MTLLLLVCRIALDYLVALVVDCLLIVLLLVYVCVVDVVLFDFYCYFG